MCDFHISFLLVKFKHIKFNNSNASCHLRSKCQHRERIEWGIKNINLKIYKIDCFLPALLSCLICSDSFLLAPNEMFLWLTSIFYGKRETMYETLRFMWAWSRKPELTKTPLEATVVIPVNSDGVLSFLKQESRQEACVVHCPSN